VVAVGEHAGDGMLHVQPFSENERRHESYGAGCWVLGARCSGAG
jgi:hypothetical protein